MKQKFTILVTASLVCLATGTGVQSQQPPAPGSVWAAAGQPTMPPAPPEMANAPKDGDAVFFFESLRPHGSWIEVSPLGPVWRPSVAMQNASWRPYSDGGKWVWVNNSWYWQSEYEWGWAPFHYGRWVKSTTLGWVWIPGREWSSAWVTWRETPTQYDWAPTPVEQSVSFGISSASDHGFSWGFQFALTQDHYMSWPRERFREPTYVYVHETVVRRDYDRDRYDQDRRREEDHRDERQNIEVQRQPARAPESTRRTTAIQQVVMPQRTQQVVTRTEVTKTQTVEKDSNQAGRRNSRVLDIMSRARK